MKFENRAGFNEYINNKGYELLEDYPADFNQKCRDYSLSLILDEEDDSFDYDVLVQTEIQIPSTFFTDCTGNRNSFSLRLKKI